MAPRREGPTRGEVEMYLIFCIFLTGIISVCSGKYIVLKRGTGYKDGPRVRVAPQLMTVTKSGLAVLVCQAEGNPTPILHWRKKKGDWVAPRRYRYHISNMPGRSVLSIDPVRARKDEDVFTCVAQNGRTTRAEVTLRVLSGRADRDSFPRLITRPSDTVGRVGENITLVCKATGDPTPDVTWIKDHLPLNSSDSRITVQESGSLHIRQLSVWDQGRYQCLLNNSVGFRASPPALLGVIARSPKIQLRIQPERQSVTTNQRADIFCINGGTQPTFFRWLSSEGTEISRRTNRYRIRDSPFMSVLSIEPTKPKDRMNVTCIADIGQRRLQLTSQLVVTGPELPPGYPKMAGRSFYPVTVEEGSETEIRCDVSGEPRPNITWLKNDVLLDVDTPRYTVDQSGALHINGTKAEDTGRYECIARNQIGVAFSPTNQLYIFRRENQTAPKPPLGLTINGSSGFKGEDLKVTCNLTAKSVTDRNIVWFKNEEEVSMFMPRTRISTSVTFDSNVKRTTSTLHIQKSRISDSGNYTCRTTDNQARSFYIQVRAPGSPPRNVRARAVSLTTIVVSWNKPKKPNGIIQGYKVFYTLQPEKPIFFWDVKDVTNDNKLTTISGLDPNQTYTISALAYSGIGQGPMSHPIQVLTTQGVPYQPLNLHAHPISANEIVVLWDAPTEAETINSYELYYNDSHFRQNIRISIKPPIERYKLTDLTPETVHHIQVSAKSERGEGPKTPTIQAKTKMFVPEAPPQAVRGQFVDAHCIIVSWDPPRPDKQNGDLAGYKIYYMEYADDKPESEAKVAIVKGNVQSYTLENLKTWTKYKIWILSYTSVGDGPVSQPIFVETDEEVPGEPRKVRTEAINSTTIFVEWRPPTESDRNGIIRGYQVYFYEVDSNDELVIGTQPRFYDTFDGTKHEAVITGLEPDTRYNVRVAAYTRKGDGIRSKPRVITTKGAVPSPPRNLHVDLQQEDPPMIKVTWQRPRETHGPLENYKIIWGRIGERYEENILPSEKYSFVTYFLDKGTTYEFRVSAKNDVDYGERSVENLKTPDGAPAGAPQNFTATGISETSVRLTWDLPARPLRNGDIAMYQITYHKLSDPINEEDLNVTDTYVDISGLEMNTDYRFKIKAYTSKGSGPWSNNLHFRTFGHMPPAPKNIKIRRTSSSIIEVTWDEPDFPVAGYKIYYNLFATPDMDVWQSLETGPYTVAHITGLESHTVYAVRVQAKSVDDRYGNLSEMVTIGFTPKFRKDVVQNFRVTLRTSNMVKLSWDPPQKPGVNSYQLKYEGVKNYWENGVIKQIYQAKEEVRIAGQMTTWSLPNLQPKMKFDFNISAIFQDSTAGEDQHIIVETLIEAGHQAVTGRLKHVYYTMAYQPLNLHADPISANEIEVMWDAPTEAETIKSYELYYNDSHFRQNIRISIKPPIERYNLTDLTPDTVYQIQVSAKSERGEGPKTPAIQVVTKKFIPGEPRKVRTEAINSTAIFVEWHLPTESDRNGIIRGYQVYFYEVDSNDELVIGTQPRFYDTFDGTKHEAVITGLEPDTRYNVRVAAYTRKGDGIRSKPRVITTKGAVPSPPSNLHVSLQQADPPIIRVTWQRPNETHGPLENYKIIWGHKNGRYQEWIFSSKKYAYMTPVLEKGVVYEFRVSAKNNVDYGESAIESLKTPDGNFPQNFTATRINETSVRLTWDPPTRPPHNGHIVMYQITYNKFFDSNNVEDLNVTNTYIDITGLEMNIGYSFNIKAYTSKGSGPWSNNLHFITSTGPPAPENVKAKYTSNSTIRVTWDEPDYSLAGYKIYYSQFALSNMDMWQSLETGPYTVAEITGLKSHTVYAVRVQAKSVDNLYGNLSKTVTIDRMLKFRKDVVQNFRVTLRTSNMVKLSWDPPQKPGVNSYQLTFKGVENYLENGTVEKISTTRTQVWIARQMTTWRLQNLQPETKYEFNISTFFQNEHKGPDQSIIVVTPMKEPSPGVTITGNLRPKSGTNTTLTCEAVEAEYTPSDLDWFKDGLKLRTNNNKVLIRKARMLKTKSLRSDLTIANIQLTDNGRYVCRSSDLQITSVKIQVQKALEAPIRLKVTETPSYGIQLKWEDPNRSSLEVQKGVYRQYTVMVTDGSTQRKYRAEKPEKLMVGFDRNVTYNLSVRVEEGDVVSNWTNISFRSTRMEGSVSTGPRDVEIERVSPTTIHISWSPPSSSNIASHVTSGYEVFVHEVDYADDIIPGSQSRLVQTRSPDKLNVTVSGLVPFVRYSARVGSYNQTSRGPRSNQLVFYTNAPPSIRNLKQELLRGEKLRVRVTWEEPCASIGAVTAYKVTWGSPQGPYNTTTLSGDRKVFVVDEVTRGTVYTVEVSAGDNIGFGAAVIGNITIDEVGDPAGPVQRVRVRALNQSMVIVWWKEPEEDIEHVQGYKVFYTDRPEIPVLMWTVRDVVEDNLLVLDRLRADTLYYFSVLAYTQHGQGPMSDLVQSRTGSSGEKRTVTIQLPSAPTNFRLKVLRDNQTSVLVTWDPPVSPRGTIRTYKMTWGSNEQFFYTANVLSTERSFIISQLEMNTTYTVSLSASTDIGVGDTVIQRITTPPEIDTKFVNRSESTNRTRKAPQNAPVKLRARPVSPTAVLVSWDELKSPYGPILGYKILFTSHPAHPIFLWNVKDVGLNTTPIVDGLNATPIVDGLEKKTYYFTVQAYSLVGAGPVSPPVKVDLLGTPHVTFSPEVLYVKEGGVASFFCQSSDGYTRKFHWMKNSEVVSVRSPIYEIVTKHWFSVLRVLNATFARDEGAFTCVASNATGTTNATGILNVYNASEVPAGYPRITLPPRVKAVDKGGRVSMSCKATGSPQPTIQWLKDSFPVRGDTSRVRLHHSGLLEVMNATDSDAGKYECVAENTLGVAYSVGVNLYVRGPDIPPYFTIAPTNMLVKPGSTINLTCVAIGSPMPFVKWREGILELTNESKVTIGQNVLQLEDVRKSKNYTCIATTSLDRIESTAAVIVGEAPTVVDGPKNKLSVVGGPLSFFCSASAYPLPSFRWMHNFRVIDPRRSQYEIITHFNISTLRLQNVKSDNSGFFTCLVRNKHGEARSTASLDVHTETPSGYPRIVGHPRLKSVEVGRTAVMQCEATGDQTPTIHWLKDYFPVNTTDHRITVLDSGNLQIQDIKVSDDGRYECVAENLKGSAYSHAALLYVKVRRVPPWFTVTPSNQTVKPGSDVNLTCVADGSPMPFVKWREGTQELTNEAKAPIGRNVLLLKNVRESKTYMCIASSTLGRVEAAAEVIVAEEPRISQRPQDQRSVVRGTVSFVCKMSGYPTPTIEWKKGSDDLEPYGYNHEIINNDGISVLRIHMVKRSRDTGTYTCIAINLYGKTGASASLTVLDETPSGYPRIVDHPRLKSVEVGRTAVMQCEATGDPRPTIHWLKDYFPVNTTDPRITVLDSGNLQIKDGQTSDEGKYECVAENLKGSSYSNDASLYVRVRRISPRFTISPSNQIVKPGSNVNLTCAAVGSPMPFVKWREGTLELTNEARVPIGRNDLLLKNVSESKTYMCTATSILGKVEAVASVVVEEPIPPTSPPRDVQARAASSNSVVVGWKEPENLVNSSFQGYRVYYTRQPGEALLNWSVVDVDRDSTITTISGLKANKMYTITVAARSRYGEGPASLPVQILTVQGYSHHSKVPSQPRELSARLLSANEIRVTWQSPQLGSILGYTLYVRDSYLRMTRIHVIPPIEQYTITNLTTNTEYEIHVSATSQEGEGPKTPAVLVRTQKLVSVQRKPIFVPTERVVSFDKGNTAVLPCGVRNLGTKTVVWRKGSNPNPLTIGRMAFIDDGRVRVESSVKHGTSFWNLIIQSVTGEDAGTYVCLVTDKSRRLRKEVELEITGAP